MVEFLQLPAPGQGFVWALSFTYLTKIAEARCTVQFRPRRPAGRLWLGS